MEACLLPELCCRLQPSAKPEFLVHEVALFGSRSGVSSSCSGRASVSFQQPLQPNMLLRFVKTRAGQTPNEALRLSENKRLKSSLSSCRQTWQSMKSDFFTNQHHDVVILASFWSVSIKSEQNLFISGSHRCRKPVWLARNSEYWLIFMHQLWNGHSPETDKERQIFTINTNDHTA